MKFLCRFSAIAVVLLAILIIPFTLQAQSTTGAIFGSALDSSGVAITGAMVTLTEIQTGVSQTAATGSGGDYTYAIVNPGDYTVAVTAKG